ncbi:sialate O-acetylesterase [Pedobacter sp.]
MLVAKADVKLPTIIADNMVLQQKIDAALWGWASPNEEIEITPSWSNKPVKIKAGANGKWLTRIKTTTAGGPYTLTFKATNTIILTDVYLGEVWLCSGQSNMEMKVTGTLNVDSVSRAATNPLIRMFTVQRATAETPQDDVVGRWIINSPASVKNFSAVAYYFGNELAARLKVPVGLIHSSWGGTPAEAWVNKELLESDESFKPILRRYEQKVNKYEEEKQNTTDKKLVNPKLHYQSPAVLYNAMLKPLVNYRIKGVIWYQGEANASRAYQYRKLFPALIRAWRDEFKIGGLPFYYVQIAPFKGQNPEIREAQLITLQTMDFVGMAVTTDVGDCDDIHPRNKIPVGKRLAYIALNNRYGDKSIAYLSPLYNRYEVLNDKIKVHFDTESNLVSKDGELKDFTIAGEDQKFHPAVAKIEGKTVIVYNKDVKNPVAVRFGWKNCPDTNLFNEAGLPASPFRTDQWKGITEGKY